MRINRPVDNALAGTGQLRDMDAADGNNYSMNGYWLTERGQPEEFVGVERTDGTIDIIDRYQREDELAATLTMLT